MENNTSLNLVVAMAENRVIGCENQLPWHLPKDLAHFKKVTMGHPILMGRKTFESIGRPLPGRTNIVLTQQHNWNAEGVSVVHSISQALQQVANVPEVMVIGGAEIYRQCLPIANKLYLTQVHGVVHGDAYFPELDLTQWRLLSREHYSRDEANPFDYSFLLYQRQSANE